MKKIGITTFHNVENYGALLQTYALYKYLSNCKYDSYIIDYNNTTLTNEYKLLSIKDIPNSIKNLLVIKSCLKRKKNFDSFRKKINISKLDNNTDILITGSDQVWNPRITGGIDNYYFLNFKSLSSKKISYAASCGSISELVGYESEFLNMINKLDYISVREKELQEYLQKNTNKNINLTLDPTLLLTKSEWLKCFDNKRIVSDKYIFVYSVGNDNKLFIDSVNLLAKKTGYSIVYFDRSDYKNRYKCNKKNWHKAGPNEFLNLLYNSEFVISTSFHALAVSIILNKEMFVVLSSKPQRLITLTSIFNLENRIVKNIDDIDILLNNKIDWNIVNNKINLQQINSQNWLIKSIED